MKTLTHLILSSALILTSVGAQSASASEGATYNCWDTESSEPAFALTVPEGFKTTDSGQASVVLSTGQKLEGSFSTHVIGGHTRVSGLTEMNVTVNYAFPDYGKPHTVTLSLLVGSDSKLSGHGEALSLTGFKLIQYILTCEKVAAGEELN
jgi:hypothetical protein